MDLTNNEGIKALLDAGRALGDIKEVRGVPVFVAPDGYQTKALDLESHQRTPYRARGNAELYDVDSFLAYVSRYKNTAGTVIFADREGLSVKAVFNYHSEFEPGWGDFSATHSLVQTPKWEQWSSGSTKVMNQLEFSEFIDDLMEDIVDPPGADIKALVMALKFRKKATFSSVIDSEGGSFIEYSEDVKGEAVKGNIPIFTEFKLGIKPFVGGENYSVRCRLRIKMRDERISLSYSIINEKLLVDDAFQSVIKKVREGAAGIPLFLGV